MAMRSEKSYHYVNCMNPLYELVLEELMTDTTFNFNRLSCEMYYSYGGAIEVPPALLKESEYDDCDTELKGLLEESEDSEYDMIFINNEPNLNILARLFG